jgi:hypothetical protein
MSHPFSLPRRRALALAVPGLVASIVAPSAHAASITGSGRVVTDTRSVGDFVAVGNDGSTDIELRQGPVTSVQVQGDDNIVPLIETVVEKGREGQTLQIRARRGASYSTRNTLKVLVTTPRLVAVANSGSGDIRMEAFDTPSLKVSLSGSGNLEFSGLQTGELSIGISGSSDVRGAGRATRTSISIAGSGDVKLADLRADDVRVSIAGSGDAEVNAAKALDVRIAGSGDVSYVGNPALKTSIAGSGEVRQR